MRRPRRAGAALLTTLALAGLAACGGTGTQGSTSGYVSADGSITTVDPGQRKTAPTLTGEDLDGKPLSSAEFAGRPMVVNVWGSWCAPCRKEAPIMKKVSEERDDVQFLGLVVRERAAPARAFNESRGIEYPSILDQGSKQAAKFGDSLPSPAVPTTWVIDRSGKVAARIVTSELTESTLNGLIDYAEKSRP